LLNKKVLIFKAFFFKVMEKVEELVEEALNRRPITEKVFELAGAYFCLSILTSILSMLGLMNNAQVSATATALSFSFVIMFPLFVLTEDINLLRKLATFPFSIVMSFITWLLAPEPREYLLKNPQYALPYISKNFLFPWIFAIILLIVWVYFKDYFSGRRILIKYGAPTLLTLVVGYLIGVLMFGGLR